MAEPGQREKIKLNLDKMITNFTRHSSSFSLLTRSELSHQLL